MSQPLLQAIGVAVPQHRICQQKHYEILASANGMTREQKLTVRKVYTGSGIKYRHSVLAEFEQEDRAEHLLFHPSGHFEETPVSRRMKIFEDHAGELGARAAEKCLDKLPLLDRKAITHVITFSCTGLHAPGLDIEMVERLGLNRNVERTCINFMGCYAAINALKSAYHICRSEPEAVVLLTGVELCSLHYQKSEDANQVVANALFADGAAAAIVSSKRFVSASEPSLALECFYAEFEQSAASDMVWRIGNTAFDLRLTQAVPHVVKHNIKSLFDKLLAKARLKTEDINHYAIHPGGVRILQACEQALGLTKQQNANSYEVLSNYGNMSSVTILVVLHEYLQQFSSGNLNEKVLACAFGPGITMESVIMSVK